MNVISDLLHGFGTPVRGYRLLREQRQIRRLAVAPIALTAVAIFASVALAWVFLPNLTDHITEWFSGIGLFGSFFAVSEQSGWFHRTFVYLTVSGTLFALKFVILTFALFAGLLVANVICSFFWELLAEKTMEISGSVRTLPNGIRVMAIFRSGIREIFKTVALIAGPLLVWFLAWIPIVGPIIGLTLAPILTAGIFGFNLVDYAMSVEELPLGKRFRWFVRFLPFLLGAGLFGYIPVLNVFLFPLLVAGASEGYAKRRMETTKLAS